MDCQKCSSDRVVRIQSKSSDLNSVEFKDNEQQGYLPSIENICGGDYSDVEICLECGQTQGTFPKDDPDFSEM